jgi:hypothetical protein
VLVSADGRVITGIGPRACGHAPRLVARSYPRKVTLTWVNPITSCHAEMLGTASGRTRLPAPLGTRALVQATSDAPISYFDERGLARVGVLPAGFRLSSDLPWDSSEIPSASLPDAAQWAVGDIRAYTRPASTSALLSIAQLAATHRFNPLAPWPWPGRVRVDGRPAAMFVGRANGLVYSRSVTWVDHGYRFVVTIYVQGRPAHTVNTKKQVPLSNAELSAVAGGIGLRRALIGMHEPPSEPTRTEYSPGSASSLMTHQSGLLAGK